MESLGYAPDEDDFSQMDKYEFFSGLITKKGARCFFCSQEGHFRMDFPLFWVALKNKDQPNHKLALAAVRNCRKIQAEDDLQSKT